MKKIIVTTLVLVTLVTIYLGFKYYIGNKVSELYETGYEKLERQEYESAIKDFDRSLYFFDYCSLIFDEKKTAIVYGQRGFRSPPSSRN